MMITWTWVIPALAWGFLFGRWFEAYLWRRNARADLQLIESWGALYKVLRRDP